MKSWSLSVILSVVLFTQISFAQLCSVLKDVRIGEVHTLCLDAGNNLWVCGSGGYAMGLGVGASDVYSLQRVLDGDMHTPSGYFENVKTFDAGWLHSLIVTQDGYCWAVGDDAYGRLGNGQYEDICSVPVRVHGINNQGFLGNIVTVSAGRSGHHSLAVRNDGYVLSWGLNNLGQCGDGSTNNRQSPVLVWSTGTDPNFTYLGDEAFIVDVEAGVNHSLALQRFADGGKVYEWGDGQVIPRKVRGQNGVGFLRNIVDIAACNCSLAADSNGNVWYWTTGGNPTRVAGGEMGTTYLQNIKKVAAGSGIYAALDNNGNIWQWSYYNSSPIKVTDGEQNTSTGFLEDIVAVDVGHNNQIIAIDSFGYGWGWNNNGGGALGIGNDDDTPSEPAEMLCADISPAVEFELSYEIQGIETDCAKPFIGYGIDDNYLVYSITYSNPITNQSDPNYVGIISNVNIINELPFEVEYYASEPCGVYDSNTRKIAWYIGNLSPGDEGVLTLTVMVNNFAKPCGKITDFAYLTANDYYVYDDINVPVCPYGGEIIYVDCNAVNGSDNGTDWENAYLDLAEAFTQIKNGCSEIKAIWVANGVYKPAHSITETSYWNKSFELVEGVGLFGNFAGGESSIDERDFNNPANETILDGRIGAESNQAVNNIIKAQNIESGIIDGFTIRNSNNGAGVYLDGSDVAIVNCKFKNNHNYGIQAANYSYTDIHNCLFVGNSSQNINAVSSSYPIVTYCTFDGNDTTSRGIEIKNYTALDVENSIFKDHTGDGICGSNGQLNVTSCQFESNNDDSLELNNIDANITKCTIRNSNCNGIYTSNGGTLNLKNSVISYNGNHGVSLNYNTSSNIVNNLIHNNGVNQGGASSGIYSNNHTVNKLIIRNCTIYDNYTYGIECGQYGADPNIANCIIYGNDTNDLYRPGNVFNKVRYSCLQNPRTGTGNFVADPCFVSTSDFHLTKNSRCVNAGNPNISYANEFDIDDEVRTQYGRADVGCDEFYGGFGDYNADDIVNFLDYRFIADNWQCNEPNYSMDDDNDVDIYDLTYFTNEWLWQNESQMQMLMSVSPVITMTGSSATNSLLLSSAESLSKQPARLRQRSKRFYSLSPRNTVSAHQQELQQMKSERFSHRLSVSAAEACSRVIPASNVIPAQAGIQTETLSEPVDVNAMLNWLDEIWLSGDLSSSMTQTEYEVFRQTVAGSNSQ